MLFSFGQDVMVSKNYKNIPTVRHSHRDHIFQLPLAQWQSGCWAVGMAVGCRALAVLCPELASLWGAPLLPLCLVAVNQHLNSYLQQIWTSSMGMQGGLATQEATVGLPQSRMHLWEQSLGVHYTFLSFADLPTTPQLNALSGSTGSVHFIPPSPWLPSLADGDWGLQQSWGLKQRCYMWILSSSSLCCSSILPIKPFLLPSPVRNMRSHGKDNQT